MDLSREIVGTKKDDEIVFFQSSIFRKGWKEQFGIYQNTSHL